MFLRAPGLASGAHASSRSRNTWSAGRPLAFSRKRGLLPGTARLERRDRSSATVPPLRVRSLCDRRVALLPESSDGVRYPRLDVTDPSGHQIGLHLVHPVDRQPDSAACCRRLSVSGASYTQKAVYPSGVLTRWVCSHVICG